MVSIAAAKQWGPIVILLMVVLGSGWGVYSLNLRDNDSSPGSAHIPSAYLENFVALRMDQHGLLKRRLEGDYMTQFVTGNSEVKKPYLVLYDQNRPSWNIRSDKGSVLAYGDVVLLSGNVHMWRNTPDNNREIDIYTRNLRVLSQSDYAETEEPVRLQTLKTTLQGTGMRVYLASNKIELLSRVKTVYDRNLDKNIARSN